MQNQPEEQAQAQKSSDEEPQEQVVTKKSAVKKEKKEKKKRNIDPNKMTYIKAFQVYKQQTGFQGLSPKKDTPEYHEIMKILKDGK